MKRRELIKNLSLLPLASGTAAANFPFESFANEFSDHTEIPSEKGLYASLGVRPVINGRGTITVIGGCRMLPEVEQAMHEATQQYVAIDELMDAVGKRIGELTGTERGVVTTGATAALIIGTTGIVTGGNPDKLWQLPNLDGMKNEVIIPSHSWTAYESAVRGVGVKMVTVDNRDELVNAIGPNTAMILVLAGPKSMEGPMSLKEISLVAKPLRVPIMVDAAAEGLPVPNPHISQGADLVAYSGGKYLSGPQCAGLLIGRKDLIQAAWVTSAPHHGFGRGYKVGREEILGMLIAVEMWMKRDHAAENYLWTMQLTSIANRLKPIAGVTTHIQQPQPAYLSNPSPSLRVEWDMAKIPLTGYDVEQLMWDGNPRVAIGGAGSFLPFPPNMEPNIKINTSQLKPGEEHIIAERVFEVLSNPPHIARPTGAANFDVSGQWDMEIKFAAEADKQKIVFQQKGNDIKGTHFGNYASRDLAGNIYGNRILFRSAYVVNGVRLDFEFNGEVSSNDTMNGKVSLSEYGTATWSAKRHHYKLGIAG
jgi:uncharacterized pyridoxal phosphate-dependent enzyme